MSQLVLMDTTLILLIRIVLLAIPNVRLVLAEGVINVSLVHPLFIFKLRFRNV